MKKSFAYICLLLILSCTSGTEKQYKSAESYDAAIIDGITHMQQYLFAVQRNIGDSATGDEILQKYQIVIDSISGSLKQMPGFNENTAYRDAAIRLGTFYKKSVGEHFSKVSHILTDAKDTAAADHINEVISQLQEEEAKADADFHKERELFAEKNNLEI